MYQVRNKLWFIVGMLLSNRFCNNAPSGGDQKEREKGKKLRKTGLSPQFSATQGNHVHKIAPKPTATCLALTKIKSETHRKPLKSYSKAYQD
jgi:hypothetical protein